MWLDGEAFGDAERHGDLPRGAVHGVDVGEVDDGGFVAQELGLHVGEVEVDAFEQEVGGDEYVGVGVAGAAASSPTARIVEALVLGRSAVRRSMRPNSPSRDISVSFSAMGVGLCRNTSLRLVINTHKPEACVPAGLCSCRVVFLPGLEAGYEARALFPSCGAGLLRRLFALLRGWGRRSRLFRRGR